MPYQANTVNGWWIQCDFWSYNPSWASNAEKTHYHETIASFLLHSILAEFVEYQTLQNTNIKHHVNCLVSGNEFFMNNILGIVKTNQHWLDFWILLASFFIWLRVLSRLPFRTLALGFGFVLKASCVVTSYDGMQEVSILFCLFNASAVCWGVRGRALASHTDVRGFEPQCGGRLSSLTCWQL